MISNREKISLIIATLGRVSLTRLLSSLNDQTYKPHEVIVVHQNNGQDKYSNIKSEIEGYKGLLNITYISRVGERGASKARNIGLQYVSEDVSIISFPDDDCYFPSRCLETVCEELGNSDFDFLSVYADDDERTGKIVNLPKTSEIIAESNALSTSIEWSLFFKASLFKHDGYFFCEEMGVGSDGLVGADEGPDLVLSLLKGKKWGKYITSTYVLHPSPMQFEAKALLTRGFKYSFARSYLLKKHGLLGLKYSESICRSLAGFILYMVRVNPKMSSYYLSCFFGKLYGLVKRVK
ncbi:glycosyltransferase family 2 protein [Ferrimonas pelagia]|uniref:Glycosyltransferase family 2 protein n=1 Tax=Ferrimonas pelagia TaxID=1177826 RepID=A0ABP9EET8_9GAMM